jgi:hypothetical protein
MMVASARGMKGEVQMLSTTSPKVRLSLIWMLRVALALILLSLLVGPRTPGLLSVDCVALVLATIQLVPLEMARRREAAEKRASQR